MINNNPYNIPQKKPLSQSKILSDTNTSRHSSTYLQNRNGNEVMYSSSIFLKNSSVNGACDQSFFEPIKQPLSPHHAKYTKQSATVQFIPSYNHPPMRSPQNHFFPLSVPKQNNMEKSMYQLKQKIDHLEKRLELKQKKQIRLNDVQTKKLQMKLQNDFTQSVNENNFNNQNSIKELINSVIQQTLQTQNIKIWQKLKELQENLMFSSSHLLGEKISKLEESFHRFQSDKHVDEHLHSRLKTIEKTIRQMGEDIHLVNDKQESLSIKLQVDLPVIKNQLKVIKGFEKKIEQGQKRNEQLRNQINTLSKKLKIIQESKTQSALMSRLSEIEIGLQNLKNLNKDIKPSFERYFSQPIVLKYIEKFQVLKSNLKNYSYSNSTRQQSCEQIVINQITYFIDHQGYLLDNDRFYLINGSQNQRIKLDTKHIEALKQKRILI